MYGAILKSQFRKGSFSFDFALSLALLLVVFSMLVSIMAFAARYPKSQSGSIASELLCLRLSSFAMNEASIRGAGSSGYPGYFMVNYLSEEGLDALDMGSLLAMAGGRHVSISVEGRNGAIFHREAGIASGDVFCAERLVLFGEGGKEGRISILRACLS